MEKLNRAAGIARRDNGRAGRGDVSYLAVEEFGCQLGVRDVVDARAAAAPFRLGELDELDPGNGAQDFPRLLPDFLAVAEMTCVVVSRENGSGWPPGGFAKADVDQELRNVLHHGRPFSRAAAPAGVVH